MKTIQVKWGVGLLLLLLAGVSSAQEVSDSRPLIISIYNNATLLPGAGALGFWGVPIHPGLTLGTEFFYRKKPHHDWLQSAKIAYHYHRYVQHGFQLLSELGYRYHFNSPFDAEAKFGLGYLHAIPAAQVFALKEGVYERKNNLGRPQGMLSLSLGAGYQLPKEKAPRLFLCYQVYFQVPFVNEYVPILPNTAVHFGMSFPFFHQKQ